MNDRTRYAGFLLIAAGILLLAGKFGVFQSAAANLWPLFLLLPGLFFHYLRFGMGVHAGVLVPGGILVTYAVLFFACNLIGWQAMAWLWPGFVFGPAVGLFEAYFFDPGRPRGLLIASGVLTAVSAVLFGIALAAAGGLYLIAADMIAAGLVMLASRPRR